MFYRHKTQTQYIMDVESLCAICFDEATKHVQERLLCGHSYHHTCIEAWFAQKHEWQCPMCRTSIAARKFQINPTYTVLLRADVSPWMSVLAALPQSNDFCDVALKWCTTVTLRNMFRFWASPACKANVEFHKLRSKFGTAYFCWRDARTFKMEFQAPSTGAIRHRFPISQLHFLAQAYIHGVVHAFEVFLNKPVPAPPVPRRPALIAPLLAKAAIDRGVL